MLIRDGHSENLDGDMYMYYASTSKNGLREVFPLHWKVTPYFSNFIMGPLYPKGLLIQVSPVQRIIQILQVFYSPKASPLDGFDAY